MIWPPTAKLSFRLASSKFLRPRKTLLDYFKNIKQSFCRPWAARWLRVMANVKKMSEGFRKKVVNAPQKTLLFGGGVKLAHPPQPRFLKAKQELVSRNSEKSRAPQQKQSIHYNGTGLDIWWSHFR